MHNDLTPAIIGVYYDVYNGTGRTYPEFICERAMTEDPRAYANAASPEPFPVQPSDSSPPFRRPAHYVLNKATGHLPTSQWHRDRPTRLTPQNPAASSEPSPPNHPIR
jgi:hypothetical protein